MDTTNQTNKNRYLKPGTKVVSNIDGEVGKVVQVNTYRHNGTDAASYLIDTAYGREVWEVNELFVPQSAQACIAKEAIATETAVRNTTNHKCGLILSGFTFDTQTGDWTEYEVITQDGIERWQRHDFVLMSECQDSQ